MKIISIIKQLMIALLLLSGSIFFANAAITPSFKVTVIGKGQPMLFIPGATCSGNEWNETVARYRKNHQCHVFTLAGYAGQPPLPDAPYLETYKNQIIAYINDNHLDNVILVGHSIGGFLSLWIASELHQHLQKVIIVDALPFFAGIRNPNAKNGFDDEQAKQMLAYYNNLDNVQLKAAQLNVAKALCADSTKWDKIADWGTASDRKTMAYSMCEMLGNDIRKTIAAIQVPVLVMAAFAPTPLYPRFTSQYVQTAYNAQYQQCKSCSVHVSPSAKHFIMYDAPDWYFGEIDTFIAANNKL